MEDTDRSQKSDKSRQSLREPNASYQNASQYVADKPVTNEILPLATFKSFDLHSYNRLCEREQILKKKAIERAKHAQEAHLVDGELKFGIDDDDLPPPENPELREGCVLTKAYGRFPTRLYGRPIEDIDPGIQYKV